MQFIDICEMASFISIQFNSIQNSLLLHQYIHVPEEGIFSSITIIANFEINMFISTKYNNSHDITTIYKQNSMEHTVKT